MDRLINGSQGAWTDYVPQLLTALVAVLSCYHLAKVYYNLFLHPLRHFPGPRLACATAWWKLIQIPWGNVPRTVKKLHDQYGPVVRIGPNELSFIQSQAWKDIYGRHGASEMPKDPDFYRFLGPSVPTHIVNADHDLHGMLRRQLAPGFSDRAMRAQEPTIGGYVDLLIRRLKEHSDDGKKPLDMRAWFNFATFDIIGDLSFGSGFGCLEQSRYHPWVSAISTNLRTSTYVRIFANLVSSSFVNLLIQTGILRGRSKNVAYAKAKIAERVAAGERNDLIEGLIKVREEIGEKQLQMNVFILTLAGSETTATLLSGGLFLIATRPKVLQRLYEEVRSSFNDEKEITLTSVNRLEYMLACLDESLRMYPPAPASLPRIVPKGGNEIAGHWVPEGTSVSVWQWAANYSEMNFLDPEEFHPERFMGDKQFAKDDLNARQPFSLGPRNCIGKTLAYAEMRLIAARILYSFNVGLAPGAQDWIKTQKAYALWDKPALPMYLTPAQKDM